MSYELRAMSYELLAKTKPSRSQINDRALHGT